MIKSWPRNFCQIFFRLFCKIQMSLYPFCKVAKFLGDSSSALKRGVFFLWLTDAFGGPKCLCTSKLAAWHALTVVSRNFISQGKEICQTLPYEYYDCFQKRGGRLDNLFLVLTPYELNQLNQLNSPYRRLFSIPKSWVRSSTLSHPRRLGSNVYAVQVPNLRLLVTSLVIEANLWPKWFKSYLSSPLGQFYSIKKKSSMSSYYYERIEDLRCSALRTYLLARLWENYSSITDKITSYQ